MSMKEIQNGSVYVNTANNEALRVRGKANSSSVLATYEDTGPVCAVQAKLLRIASWEEVERYTA